MQRADRRLVVRLLCAAAFALAAGAAGAYPEWFTLERAAVARGELWRLWTGHLVHGSWTHYAYDVGAAALLCVFFRPARRLLWIAPLVSVVLLASLPGLQHYYGLSACLHAWVVSLSIDIMQRERGSRSRLAGLLLIGVLGKAFVETLSGTSLFTSELDFGGPVLHASHLVGAVVGLLPSVLRFGFDRAVLYRARMALEFCPGSRSCP